MGEPISINVSWKVIATDEPRALSRPEELIPIYFVATPSASWISVDPITHLLSKGKTRVYIARNLTTSARTGTVKIKFKDPSNTITITVIQGAAPAPEASLYLGTNSATVAHGATSTDAIRILTGNVFRPSDISVAEDKTWITRAVVNNKLGGNHRPTGVYPITLTLEPNPTRQARTAVITINVVGVSTSFKFTLTQSGASLGFIGTPEVIGIAQTTATFSHQANDAGTVHYAVLPTATTAPTD